MVDIVGARVTLANVVLDSPAPPVSLSASFQIQPAVVGNGTNYFCVWRDNRHGDGRWNIYGARVTRQGVVLDPGGIPITSLDTVQTNPAVAFNGNHSLVVWLDTRTGYQNLYAARVSQDGQVMETNGFLIAQNATTADVANLGTNFLVVWGDSNGKLSCARVSGSGQVLDPAGIGLFNGGGSAHSAKVTSNGTNCFVTWSANYSGTMCVDGNGTILSSNYPSYVGTQLASDGRDFIGIRSDPYGIFGALFPDSGVVTSTFSVSTEYYHSAGYLMAVAGNGKDYLLAYSPAYADFPANQGRASMYLSQITRSGRVIQTNGAPAFTNRTNPKEIAMAGNCRDYLLVYQRTDESAVPRLRARILDAAPQLIKPTNGSGQFSFTVDAAAERAYEIQSSVDLQLWLPPVLSLIKPV